MTWNPHRDLPGRPTVRVVAGLGQVTDTTVVFVHGEHDFGSRGIIEEALMPLRGLVLVDLSRCGFIDSSVIAVLLAKSTAIEREGGRLELIVPPRQAYLTSAVARLGVRGLLAVHDEPPPALA